MLAFLAIAVADEVRWEVGTPTDRVIVGQPVPLRLEHAYAGERATPGRAHPALDVGGGVARTDGMSSGVQIVGGERSSTDAWTWEVSFPAPGVYTITAALDGAPPLTVRVAAPPYDPRAGLYVLPRATRTTVGAPVVVDTWLVRPMGSAPAFPPAPDGTPAWIPASWQPSDSYSLAAVDDGLASIHEWSWPGDTRSWTWTAGGTSWDVVWTPLAITPLQAGELLVEGPVFVARDGATTTPSTAWRLSVDPAVPGRDWRLYWEPNRANFEVGIEQPFTVLAAGVGAHAFAPTPVFGPELRVGERDCFTGAGVVAGVTHTVHTCTWPVTLLRAGPFSLPAIDVPTTDGGTLHLSRRDFGRQNPQIQTPP